MGRMHIIAFLFLSIFHLSFAKDDCLDCTNNNDVNDISIIQYLSTKIINVNPKGTENEEQVELLQIKEIERQDVKDVISTYNFQAQGLKSNNVYECQLVIFQQEWNREEEVKNYSCKIVPSNQEDRLIPEEEFPTDIENSFNPTSLKVNKKKYIQCMKRAAIRCLL